MYFGDFDTTLENVEVIDCSFCIEVGERRSNNCGGDINDSFENGIYPITLIVMSDKIDITSNETGDHIFSISTQHIIDWKLSILTKEVFSIEVTINSVGDDISSSIVATNDEESNDDYHRIYLCDLNEKDAYCIDDWYHSHHQLSTTTSPLALASKTHHGKGTSIELMDKELESSEWNEIFEITEEVWNEENSHGVESESDSSIVIEKVDIKATNNLYSTTTTNTVNNHTITTTNTSTNDILRDELVTDGIINIEQVIVESVDPSVSSSDKCVALIGSGGDDNDDDDDDDKNNDDSGNVNCDYSEGNDGSRSNTQVNIIENSTKLLETAHKDDNNNNNNNSHLGSVIDVSKWRAVTHKDKGSNQNDLLYVREDTKSYFKRHSINAGDFYQPNKKKQKFPPPLSSSTPSSSLLMDSHSSESSTTSLLHINKKKKPSELGWEKMKAYLSQIKSKSRCGHVEGEEEIDDGDDANRRRREISGGGGRNMQSPKRYHELHCFYPKQSQAYDCMSDFNQSLLRGALNLASSPTTTTTTTAANKYGSISNPARVWCFERSDTGRRQFLAADFESFVKEYW
jgi:hypothetical protein